MFKFNSIRHKLMIPTLFLTVMLLSLLGTFLAVNSYNGIKTMLAAKANSNADFLAKVSIDSYKNFEYFSLDNIIEEMQIDPEVDYAVFYDDNGIALTKGNDIKSVPSFIVIERIISGDGGKKLGSLKIGYNRSRIDANLRNSLIIIVLSIVIAILFFLFGMKILSERVVIQRITEMKELSERMSEGDLTTTIITTGHDEIAHLGNVMNKMAFNIKELLDKTLTRNTELEEWVADELRKNREKDVLLLQKDKLASIGQLAAGVAHEINNPMGFIMSNMNTLKDYTDSISKYCKLLSSMLEKNCTEENMQVLKAEINKLDIEFIMDDIEPLIVQSIEGADRVKRIVLDLKDFARAEDESFEPTDLNACIRNTVNMVNNEIKYVADVDLQLGDIPQINCSRHQINQVLVNMLVNAGHAIEKHGTITLNTRLDGEQVILLISDTGCGMTEDIRNRIFDPFFTTKKVGDGTGLGLSISHGIIKKHGGEIEVESEPGVGTIFTIRLPINAKPEN